MSRTDFNINFFQNNTYYEERRTRTFSDAPKHVLSSDKTVITNPAPDVSHWSVNNRISRSGSVTPNYFAVLRAKKYVPGHAFTYSKAIYWAYRETYNSTSYDNYGNLTGTRFREGIYQTGQSFTLSGQWYNPPEFFLSSAELDSYEAIMQNQILRQIKDLKVNLMQVIAERDQTIRLVTDVIKSVTGVVHGLRHGDIVGAANSVGIHISRSKRRRFSRDFKRNQSKAIANAWIGFQYGVKPLLDDVRGAAEALAKLMQERPPTQKVSCRRTVKNSLYQKGTVMNPSTGQVYNRVDVADYQYDFTMRIWYRPSTTVSSIPSSLGLLNVASIAWELTPWSFVVDWFYPIGAFLETLDATIGVEFVDGSFTTFVKRNALRTLQYRNDYGAIGWESAMGSSRAEIVYCNRKIYTGFPTPRLPRLKNPASMTHFYNAMALLRQQFR